MIATNGTTNTFDSQDRFLFMPGGPNALPQPGAQDIGSDLQSLGQAFQKLGSDLDAGQQNGSLPTGGTSGRGDMMSEIMALLQEIEQTLGNQPQSTTDGQPEQTLGNQPQSQSPGENSPEPGGVQPVSGGYNGGTPGTTFPIIPGGMFPDNPKKA